MLGGGQRRRADDRSRCKLSQKSFRANASSRRASKSSQQGILTTVTNRFAHQIRKLKQCPIKRVANESFENMQVAGCVLTAGQKVLKLTAQHWGIHLRLGGSPVAARFFLFNSKRKSHADRNRTSVSSYCHLRKRPFHSRDLAAAFETAHNLMLSLQRTLKILRT